MDTIKVTPKPSGARGKWAWGGGIGLSLILCLVIIDLITDRIASGQVAELVDEYNEKGLAELSYENAGSSLFGSTVTVSEIKLAAIGSTLDVGELVLYDYELTEKGFPVVLNARLRDITIDPDTLFPPFYQDQPFVQMLNEMGYTEPTEAELHVDYMFDQDRGLTDVREISLSINDVGSIELESEFAGLSTEAVAGLLLGLGNTIPIQIGSLEFEYRDDSFVSRAMQYIAEKKGMDSADAVVDELLVTWERDQGLQALIAEELQEFLRKPHSMRVSITPDSPVTMPQMGATNSPEELAELLNFQFDAN